MDPAAMASLPSEYLAEYNGTQMIAAAWVTLVLIIILTSLRVYGRCFLMNMGTRGLNWDDILMVMGTLFGIMYCISMLLTYHYGGGYHFAAIMLKRKPELDVTKYMLMVFIAGPPFIIAMGFIKCSMLALYFRLSRPGSLFRRITVFTIVFVVLMTTALSLWVMLPCQPVDKFWNIMKPGTCAKLGPFYFTQSSLHIATDFLVCLLPLRIMYRLQIPRRQKITLMILFSFGFFASLAGVVKLTYMPILLKSEDTPFIGTSALVWTFVELSAATLAACGPSLKVFVKLIAPKLLGSNNASKVTGPIHSGGVYSHNNGGKSLTGHYNSIHLKSMKSAGGKSQAQISLVMATEVGNESMEQIIPESGIIRTTEVRQDVQQDLEAGKGGINTVTFL